MVWFCIVAIACIGAYLPIVQCLNWKNKIKGRFKRQKKKLCVPEYLCLIDQDINKWYTHKYFF